MSSFAALFFFSCLSLLFGRIDLAVLFSDNCLCGFLVPLLHLMFGLPCMGAILAFRGFIWDLLLADLWVV